MSAGLTRCTFLLMFHLLLSFCLVLLVSGQTILPEQLKPELQDRTWNELRQALGPVYAQQELALLQVRTRVLFSTAAYDALSVYSKAMEGLVVGGSLRRPVNEHTWRNKRIAIAYSTYRTIVGAYGATAKASFDAVFQRLGLNPDDYSEDPKSPVGIGNTVGKRVLQYYLNDEFNQLGNRPNVTYNRQPASDWTGYVPKNTAYKLKCKTRWQPLEVVINGAYTVVQTYVANQLGRFPLSNGQHPSEVTVPKPTAILKFNMPGYKAQVDRILHFSAILNDTLKMYAEGVDYGFFGAGIGDVHLANKHNWGLNRQVMWDFLTAMTVSDTQIAVFYWKTYYDTVRPVSAVLSSGLYTTIRAWGGPGKGTVTMPAKEWRQYNVRTDPSPEYPSGATTFFASYADVAASFVGTQEFGWSPVSPPGCSLVDPGVPKAPIKFYFRTFNDLKTAAVLGREAGGVHFKIGADEGVKLGEKLAAVTVKSLVKLFKQERF